MLRERTRFFTGVVLLFAVAVLMVSIGILSWVPPVSKDALVHHLAVPKLYLQHGGIYELPTMPYSYYPMNLDLLYMVPLWLGTDIAAKFIHFGFGLLTACLLFWYLRKRLNTLYALFGSLFFLSVPIVVKLSITVYVDLGVIFFSTLALLLILHWAEHGFRFKYLILSGIACGLAMGTKYNGIVTCAVLGLMVPFLCARDGKGGKGHVVRPITLGALFVLIALIVFSPWMIRNAVWKGNPVYPLYDSFFKKQGGGIKAEPLRGKSITIAPLGKTSLFTYRKIVYGERWWEMALLPVRIFFQGRDGNPQFFDGVLNPFLLILTIFAFFPRSKDPPELVREKKILLVYAALFFAFAFFTSALRVRYISPIIPPLVILSTFGLRNLMHAAGRMKARVAGKLACALILLLTVCGMAFNAWYLFTQFDKMRPFGYISGKVGRDQYITRYRREYPVMQYANRTLPLDAKISFLFLGKRGYYCDREYVPDTEGQVRALYRSIKDAETPERIWSRFRTRGITHIMVDLSIFDKWLHGLFSVEERGRVRDFFQKYLLPLYFREGIGLYQVKDSPEG